MGRLQPLQGPRRATGRPGSRAVSFDRPYQFRRCAARASSCSSSWPRCGWPSTAGIPLGYATDVDLHADPHLLDGARAMITLGHDEYWSTAMRDGRHRRPRPRGQPGLPRRQRGLPAHPLRATPRSARTAWRSTTSPSARTRPARPTRWRPPRTGACHPTRARKACWLGNYLHVLPRPRRARRRGPGQLAAHTGIVQRRAEAHRRRRRSSTPASTSTRPPPARSRCCSTPPCVCGTTTPARFRRRRLLHHPQRRRRVLQRHPGLGLRPGPRLHRQPRQPARRPGPDAISTRLFRTFAAGPAGRAHPAVDNLARLGIRATPGSPAPADND